MVGSKTNFMKADLEDSTSDDTNELFAFQLVLVIYFTFTHEECSETNVIHYEKSSLKIGMTKGARGVVQ